MLAVLLCLGYCLSFATNVAAEKKKNSPHVNYMLHCQGCHLPDGKATPGLGRIAARAVLDRQSDRRATW